MREARVREARVVVAIAFGKSNLWSQWSEKAEGRVCDCDRQKLGRS